MANDYYTRQNDYTPLKIARGDSLQADLDAVVTAFEKLPNPVDSGRGFKEAVTIGEGTDDNHALRKTQINDLFDDKVLAGTNYQGNWSSLTGALTSPATAHHNNALWFLLNDLADVTASEPGVTTDWLLINGQLFDLVTELSLTYNGDGTVDTLTETQSFGDRTTEYTYNGDGTVNTATITAAGKQRVETFAYSGGKLTGMTSTEGAAP